VDVVLIAAAAVDEPDSLEANLDRLYDSNRHYLG
jgi:hypothetical protein